MPIFRDNSPANRTAENGLLSGERGHYRGFSPQGTCAVRFQGGHKANAMRSEAEDSAIARVFSNRKMSLKGARTGAEASSFLDWILELDFDKV